MEKVDEYSKSAWREVEARHPVREEIVDGYVMTVLKVGDDYFLGIEEKGKQATQRQISPESARQEILVMMALRVEREEKSSR